MNGKCTIFVLLTYDSDSLPDSLPGDMSASGEGVVCDWGGEG